MLASYLNWTEKQISNLGVMSSSLIEATKKKSKNTCIFQKMSVSLHRKQRLPRGEWSEILLS